MPARTPVGGSNAMVEPRFLSLVLYLAPPDIAFFKAVVESYDNLATLRTEDPALSRLRLWFAAELQGEVDELLAALSATLSIRIVRSD